MTWAEPVKCPLPGIWIFSWKGRELIHPDSSAQKNFPFVFVPWSSPQPWGWSFLRPVCLTFLQLLCAAPCHSSKFLFYRWVSLNNFCCLPPKNSGIQTPVWPAELVGQQPSTPVKEPLILTCEESYPQQQQIQASKCTWMNFCEETDLAVTQDGLGNVRTELLIKHCLSPNYEALFCMHPVWEPAQVKSRLTQSIDKRNGNYWSITSSQKM